MAEIRDIRGNIFTTSCEVITLTVNCEGVMGAGIALEGKLRWPAMYEQYVNLCEKELMRPGVLDWWGPDNRGKKILCFPTKAGWRQPSKKSFITKGLESLVSELRDQGVTSIAMPHLGCSHGGLIWGDVRPLVIEALNPVKGLTVELWEFDQRAGDPDFDVLINLLKSKSHEEVASLLCLDTRAAEALLGVLHLDRVVNLSGLQTVRGIGDKTLEKIYGYLFSGGVAHYQQSFGDSWVE